MNSPIPVYAPKCEPTRRLRVGFDARKLDGTGIGSYLRHLLNYFVTSKEVEPVLFGRLETLSSEFPDIESVPFELSSNNPFAFSSLRSNPILTTLDLFHAPHYVGVQRLPIPISLTVHDCIHLSNPEKFYLPLVSSPLMRNSLSVANKIISVSEATQEDVMRRFPDETQGKISVIRPPLNQSKDISLSQSPSHVMCVVSTPKKHKGILDLIDAWKSIDTSMSLLIVGSGSEKFKNYESKNIKVLGFVSESNLNDLYSKAGFVVIPSLAEGFGYVMAEAHRAGLFTVIRPVPALLEQKQEADLVASDFSVDALKSALTKGIDKLQFGRLSSNELKRSTEEFNPERVARETYWAYVECCS